MAMAVHPINGYLSFLGLSRGYGRPSHKWLPTAAGASPIPGNLWRTLFALF